MVVASLIHALRFSGCSIDDAYISFRYAWHLAHGHGLVFNPGERVEGYSNFLWTCLAALSLRLGAPAHVLMPVLGLGAFLALVWVTVQTACALKRADAAPHALTGALAGAVVALSSGLAYHAFAGLETAAFTLAFTLAVQAVITGRAHRFALCSAVAFLLRPEGGLVVVWGLAMLAAAPATRRRSLTAGAILAVLLVPYLAWKYAYFQELLPNTLRAKTPDRRVGLQYLGAWLTFSGGLLAVALAGLRGMLREERWLLGLVVAHSVAVVFEGGDWMWGARLFLPSLPCLAVLFERRVLPHVAGVGVSRAGRVAALAALVLWGGQNLRDGARISHANEIQEPQDAAHAAIAREFVARGARSAALFDIGVFGYTVPGMRIADLGGLTDAVLARKPGGIGRKRIDDAWLALRTPDLVLVNAFPVGALGDPDPVLRVQWPVERRLLSLTSFRDGYILDCAASVAGYHVMLAFRRRAAALSPAPSGAHCTTLPEALRHSGRWSSSLAAQFSLD